jgi:hypothetical protein
MSNIGLHAGFYGEIREFAELVDSVIADISLGAPGPANRQKLADRLKDMTATGSDGLLLRYLGPDSGITRQSWVDLAGALQQDRSPAWVSDRLESLARLLDSGRSAALERLHGIDVR